MEDKKNIRILLVEDSDSDAGLFKEFLADTNDFEHEIERSSTLMEGIKAFSSRRHDVVMLDLDLPDSEGVNTLKSFLDSCAGATVIVMTSTDAHEVGLNAVAAGAQDYISKGEYDGYSIARIIKFSLERMRYSSLVDEVTKCFLGFGPDTISNIEKICTALGKVMGADAAMFNRVENGILKIITGWNVPPDMPREDRCEGHICTKVVNDASREPSIFEDLQFSDFSRTDVNVVKYKLKTYIGSPIFINGQVVAVLCAVFTYHAYINPSQLNVMKMLARAVEIEEYRRLDSESLLEFRMAVEQGSSAVIVTDMDGKIEYANGALTRISGFLPEDVVGKKSGVLGSEKNGSALYQEMWKYLKSGNSWKGEFINRKKDGGEYVALASISPIRNRSGKIVKYISIMEDITDRKRTEEQLSYLATYPELNPSAVMEIDESGAIIYFNPSSFQVIRDIKTGVKIEKYISGNAAIFADAISCLRKGSDTEKVEIEIGARFYSVQCSSIGKSVRLYFRDVTEEKEVAKLKSEFVSTVSHELRTPLSIMREAVSIVMDGIAGPLTDKQNYILHTSIRNMDRLAALINDLLDISRIEAGKMDLKLAEVDLGKLVESAEENFRKMAEKKNILIESRIPGDMPAVLGDETKILQILTNLLGNAVKFTDEGKISIEASVEHNNAVVSISDTGRGIAEEDMPKLFEKFSQIDRFAGKETPGTGLGLAISKQLIELMGGKISAESAQGKGSTFSFTLPVFIHKPRDKKTETTNQDDTVPMI